MWNLIDLPTKTEAPGFFWYFIDGVRFLCGAAGCCTRAMRDPHPPSGRCLVYSRVCLIARHASLGLLWCCILSPVKHLTSYKPLSQLPRTDIYTRMERWKGGRSPSKSDITRFMNPSEGKNTEYFARHSGSYVLSICAARDIWSATTGVAKLVIGGNVR